MLCVSNDVDDLAPKLWIISSNVLKYQEVKNHLSSPHIHLNIGKLEKLIQFRDSSFPSFLNFLKFSMFNLTSHSINLISRGKISPNIVP